MIINQGGHVANIGEPHCRIGIVLGISQPQACALSVRSDWHQLTTQASSLFQYQ